MSKKRIADTSKTIEPQVGDVWKSNDGTAIIFIIAESPHNEFYSVVKENTTGEFLVHDIVKDDFIKFCKYLGKSKANIDDLFKTENE